MNRLQSLRIRFRRWHWNQEAEALLKDMDYHRRAEIVHREALRATWAAWRTLQKKIKPDDEILVHLASPEQAARLARNVIQMKPKPWCS